ncbi:MAG: class I SAM-dependent methyltransferase [Chloroflexota bacterium]
MNLLSNPSYLLTHQYQNASNLEARMQLHERFSTNPYPWHRWVFDQFELPAEACVLELGCGPARLWTENLDRVPAGWAITLSDFSTGMLAQAQQNLAQATHPFRFEQVDAQSIPFDDAAFDAVIANQMLYHVPDLPQALGEIRRVLKPGGRLYAGTNGANHLRELDDLIRAFDPDLTFMQQISLKFTLENGGDQLAPCFGSIQIVRQPNALVVTEAGPLVDYVRSMMRISLAESKFKEKFPQYVADVLQKNGGQIRISKDAGLFTARC